MISFVLPGTITMRLYRAGIGSVISHPDFKPIEFDGLRKQSGLNSFTLTPKQWIEKTKMTFPTFIMAGAHPLRDVITHGYDAGRTAPPPHGMAYGPRSNHRT